MKFREGLLQIYQNRQIDAEITDPFYLYCRLSDLCSSTFEDKKKVELFYSIDKRLCVFETLIKQGKNGEKTLLDSYVIVSDLLSEESFQKLIECAVWVLNPASKIPPAETKKEPQIVPPSPPSKPPQKVVPVKVERQEESVQQVSRTPLQVRSNSGAGLDVDLFLGLGAVLLFITLAVGLVLLCIWMFGGSIAWAAWQWIIGVVGGGWLSLIIGIIVYLLHDSLAAEYPVSGIISLAAVAVINFVCLLLFRSGYRALFGCIGGWNIIGGIILSSVCFEDTEDEWGWTFVAATIVLLVGMVLSLIFLPV